MGPNKTMVDAVGRWAAATHALLDDGHGVTSEEDAPQPESAPDPALATPPPERGDPGVVVADAVSRWASSAGAAIDRLWCSDSDGSPEAAQPGGREPEPVPAAAGGESRTDRSPKKSAGMSVHRLAAVARRSRAAWRWTAWRITLLGVVGSLVLAGIGWVVAQKVTALPGDAAFAVDGQVVTVSSFTRRLAVLEALYGVQVPSGAKAGAVFRRTAAQAMAVQMVVDRAAANAGIHITYKAAQAQLQRDVSQQYPQGFSSFVNQLGARGLSEGEVREAVSQEMAVQQLFTRVVGTVRPSTAELEQLYRQHQGQLGVPETRAIAHIVVSSQSEAQSILQQLQAGVPFATLARRDSLDTSTASSGGSLGTLSEAELTAPFGKAAFAAKPGVPFGPVHDQDGWEIGLVTAVVPGHSTTFAQARSELQDYVVVRTDQARWSRWLDAKLRAAGLRFAAAYRPAHPDVAPRATLPSLGPPEAVGSVPVGSAAGAPSAPSTTTTPGHTSAGAPGSSISASAAP